MVELTVAACCICSKSAAKFLLQVDVQVGRDQSQKCQTGPLFARLPAVFAVFAGNYQRRTTPLPQKCSTAVGIVNERTAG
jgi:hypothetical protein